MNSLYQLKDSSGNLGAPFYVTPLTVIPNGYTLVPYSPTLGEAQESQKDLIDSWRLAACHADVSVSVGGVTYPFQADEKSQKLLGNVITLNSAGITSAVPPVWRSSNNIDVPVTITDIVNIAIAIANQINTAYAHSFTLKADVDAATTISAVQAVTW